MPLNQLLIFLIGLIAWAAWIIALGDVLSRSGSEFQRGSKRLWLLVLLVIPVLTGLVWMAPALPTLLPP